MLDIDGPLTDPQIKDDPRVPSVPGAPFGPPPERRRVLHDEIAPPWARSRLVRAGVIFVVVTGLPFLLSTEMRPPLGFPWSTWLTGINLALIASIAAAAFGLLLAYSHQLSVAHAAFLMLGTMWAGWAGTIHDVNFAAVLVSSFIVGALAGTVVALPAMRFRGLYLLIATLGVHFIAARFFRVFQTGFFGFGAITFEPPTLPAFVPIVASGFAFDNNFRWYWLLVTISAFSLWIMHNLVQGYHGRAFRAIGEHDQAAATLGIDVPRTKLLAFAISSGFVTMAGALGSYYLGARGDESFSFLVVLHYGIMVVVGGWASIWGAAAGAFFFYLAPIFIEWAIGIVPVLSSFSWVQSNRPELTLGLFGVAIILVLTRWPSGIVGAITSIRRSVKRAVGARND